MDMNTHKSVLIALLVVASVAFMPLMGGLNAGQVKAQSAGEKVYTASNDQTVVASDASDGSEIWTYNSQNIVESVAPSVDGTVVYAAQRNGRVAAIDATNGTEIWDEQVIATDYNIDTVAPSSDGDEIYIGSQDSAVRALDASDGTILWEYNGHTAGVNDVYPSQYDDVLYTASNDESVKALYVGNQTEKWSVSHHTNSVMSVAESPDGSSVYTGGNDNTLRKLDSNSGSQQWEYTEYSDIVSSISPSPGGETVYTGTYNSYDVVAVSSDGTTEQWRSNGSGRAVVASPSGDTVFSGSMDDELLALDSANGSGIYSVIHHTNTINTVAVDGMYDAADQVTGTVTDQNGEPISQATVSFTNTDTDATDSVETSTDGTFEIPLANGTYEIEISHNQYIDHTETRMIEEGEDLGTFELQPAGVRLVTSAQMNPNSSMSYSVDEWTGDSWEDVALDDPNLTVSSDNESVATVDPAEGLILSEPGVNTSVNITATYTKNGTTYNYTQKVVVATLEIGNLDILPAAYWPTTILKDGVMQWVGMGLMVGMVFARITRNPWAGLGVSELVLSFGWFLGFVGTGVFIASIFYVVAASMVVADVYRPQR